MTEADRRKRLIEWLDAVYLDVQDLIIDNHVFWETQKIIKNNSRLTGTPSIFKQWMAAAFVESAALGVRRQVDGGKDTISLRRFLAEILSCPTLVSRNYYLSLCTHSSLPLTVARDMANHTYDRLVGHGLNEPNRAQLQNEIDELVAATGQIHHYVDRRKAHYDVRGLQKPIPTFNDLEACLSLFERLIKKYKNLLTGVSVSTLLPSILYDWKAIFYFPWLERRPFSSGAEQSAAK